MHISIWSQFSSNHSADFTLVGEFESAEAASRVADEMRQMLREIGAWWEQIADKSGEIEALVKRSELTPPEQRYKAQYQVEWFVGPLDWVWTKSAADGVTQYENLVFIEPTSETWAGPVPFRDIFTQLGAKVAVSSESGESSVVNITATAPDEATARRLVEGVKTIKYDEYEYELLIPIPGLKERLMSYGGEVTRDGHQVLYKAINFGSAEDETGQTVRRPQILALFVTYLRNLGCTDITWHFEEARS